jgi:hypothetical protein
MKLDHCRSARCEAPIIWTVTARGKRMPVDADPVVAPRGFRLDEVDGGDVLATFVVAPAPGERLYVSHYATCPDADGFRR